MTSVTLKLPAPALLAAFCLLGAGLSAHAADPALPDVVHFKLGKGEKLGHGPDKENSGIVKSRTQADVFWTHNDHGNDNRIYAVHRNGKVYANGKKPEEAGVELEGARNVDWEDIAVDASGRVIVSDLGNNDNDRRDLTLYYVKEPDARADRAQVIRKVVVSYPDQTEFPAPTDNLNFDAEAIFTLGDNVYICTKHRSDSKTTVYRVIYPPEGGQGVVTRVDEFDVHGKATGADATADGKHIVVLTYDSLWLFDVTNPAHPLSGPVRWLPYKGPDHCEAVCFIDDATLLVGDESQARLYEAPVARFTPIAR